MIHYDVKPYKNLTSGFQVVSNAQNQMSPKSNHVNCPLLTNGGAWFTVVTVLE